MMITFLFCLVLGWIQTAGAEPSVTTQDITLERAIQLATGSATAIIKNENNEALAGINLLQSYGAFLPNLSVSSTYNKVKGRSYITASVPVTVDTADSGANWQISSSLNLFNGLADISGLNATLDRASASKFTLARAKEQIALDVTQVFMQVIYDRRLVAITEADVAASSEREKLLEEQTKVGAKDVADLYRQQAMTSRDQSTLIQVQNKLRSDELALLRRLRLDPLKVYNFVSPKLNEADAKSAAQNEIELVRAALANRLDLRASKVNLEASKYDVDVADSTLFPKLDLTGSLNDAGRTYDYHNVNNINAVPANQDSLGKQFKEHVQYTVGLTLTWNIFDRNLTKANRQRAKVAVKNAELDYEDLRNSIVGEVRQAYADYASAKSQYSTDQRGLQAAQRAYDVLKGRYSAGSAKFVDLVDSQAALTRAESTLAQSTFNVELQRRALQVVVGLPMTRN